jgi:hypothetical protein
MTSSLLRALALVAAASLVACAPATDEPDLAEESEVTDEELNEPGFDRNRVMSNAAFTDHEAMTAEEIQAFLEETPYGNRSVLAGLTTDGVPASQAIWDAAQQNRINPLVILVRAQMEQSLIGKTTASQRTLDRAFGCGCPDDESCSPQFRGFGKQVACLGAKMRSYLDDLRDGGSTIAGWKVGQAKKTLDPLWVTPFNKATAALYTYTPWVGTSGFGNVAHFKIMKKFATAIGYFPAGPGGCLSERFPSGLVAQLVPSPSLSDAYGEAPGGEDTSPPRCFLDRRALEDPFTGVVAPSTAKLSDNFVVDEMFAGEPSTTRHGLVDPAFVERLQALRDELAKSVTVVDGYRAPERHAAICEEICGATSCQVTSCAADVAVAPFVRGRAALLTAAASEATLLAAARDAGFTGCAIDGGDLYVEVDEVARGCPAP